MYSLEQTEQMLFIAERSYVRSVVLSNTLVCKYYLITHIMTRTTFVNQDTSAYNVF